MDGYIGYIWGSYPENKNKNNAKIFNNIINIINKLIFRIILDKEF